jgi:hypothetical protein
MDPHSERTIKVKVRVRVKLALEQAMKAQMESREVEVQLHSFYNLCARRGLGA